jgi:two-component system, LytTR family, sensor histidine kinase AlgZ
LPDFCSLRMVFAVVILAQLFAFVLVLMNLPIADGALWKHTAMVSLFVQWSALCSSAGLCFLRAYLCRMPVLWAALLSYLVVVLIVLLLSEIGFQLLYFDLGLGASHLKFVLRNLLIAVLVTGPILRYFYVQQAWQRNVKAEAQSRLQSLQARIRPHFLFNSMNTIASLIRTEPVKAETAIEDLADLFHTLADEIDLCERYLEIEALRLGERLKVEWDIKAVPTDALLPPILLQPLLENAIYHGIETLSDGGTIRIQGSFDKKKISLQIENPCQSQHTLLNKGNHIAQENIRERLQALYGKHASLAVEAYTDRNLALSEQAR